MLPPELAVFLATAACLGLPLFYSWRLVRLAPTSRLHWLTVALEASVILLFVLIAGPWHILGYWTRIAVAAVTLAAIAESARRHRAMSWSGEAGMGFREQRATLAVNLVLGFAALWTASGLWSLHPARALHFPLHEGWFMVGQGGGNILLNHHYSHPEQRYAADIVALNKAGFRAGGLQPGALESYVIWGAPVLSPCEGEVLEAVDGRADVTPPLRDSEYPPGNHVVLACEGLIVELAHLREGSVSVRAGDRVMDGQRLGEVGNSGNSTEPHLHLHAVDAVTGLGVPLVFDGRFPARNRSFGN